MELGNVLFQELGPKLLCITLYELPLFLQVSRSPAPGDNRRHTAPDPVKWPGLRGSGSAGSPAPLTSGIMFIMASASVQNVTWSVASASHRFGSQRFENIDVSAITAYVAKAARRPSQRPKYLEWF